MQFFSSKHSDPESIVAGLNNGTVKYWQTDATGTRWYKSTSTFGPIHAVPAGNAIHVSEVARDSDGPNVITCEPFASDEELDELIAREAAGEIEQIGSDQFGRTFFIECEDAE